MAWLGQVLSKWGNYCKLPDSKAMYCVGAGMQNSTGLASTRVKKRLPVLCCHYTKVGKPSACEEKEKKGAKIQDMQPFYN